MIHQPLAAATLCSLNFGDANSKITTGTLVVPSVAKRRYISRTLQRAQLVQQQHVKSKKKKKAKPIQKGFQVKSCRKLQYSVTLLNTKKSRGKRCPVTTTTPAHLEATVKSRNTKIGHVIAFDKFLFGFKDVDVRHNKTNVVKDDEEEMECDRSRDDPAKTGGQKESKEKQPVKEI